MIKNLQRQTNSIAVIIFVMLSAIYIASPIRTTFDSRWALHTAMSFIEGRSGALTDYVPLLKNENFYAIEYTAGEPRTFFPIGVSLIAMPVVAVMNVVNPKFRNQLEQRYSFAVEKVIAGVIGAAAASLFFLLIASRFNVYIALATTVVFALGTSMWSTATRALWQHGPLVLMLTMAMLIVNRSLRQPSQIQYLSLPLAMAYVIRPTASVAIAVLSAYVFAFHRPWFVRYLCWAALIAVPWLAFNISIYQSLLSPYYLGTSYSGTSTLLTALLGNLVSPGRGLFIYSPVLILAVSGFVLSLRQSRDRWINISYGAIVVGTTIAISLVPAWWAGHSFGPRYMTDVLPFLCYFMAFNLEAAASWSVVKQFCAGTIIAALAIVSITIHAQAALRAPPWAWNAVPDNIDNNPQRLWDWRDLAFLRTRKSLP
jgi:hypothetical protein